MNSTNNDISIIKFISKPSTDFLKDVTELSIDKIISEIQKDAEILKSLPIVKWIFLGHTIANNIHLGFFLKKYALFIAAIPDVRVTY
jgi:hypothetical protein